MNGGIHAHTHNLIVQTTIKIIKNGKEKVETIVQCLKYSAHVLTKLHSIQKHTNTLAEAKAGSWHLMELSCLDMLLRFINNKEPIL